MPAHMVLMMICGKELWVPLDREIARQMVGDFTKAVPARRREVVRVNRAGCGGDGSATFHAIKMISLRYRNNKKLKIKCAFSGICRFPAPPLSLRASTR